MRIMTYDEFLERNMSEGELKRYIFDNLWRKDFYVEFNIPGHKIRFHITTLNPYGKTWYTVACEENTGNGFVKIDECSDLELSYFRYCIGLCFHHNIWNSFFTV